MAISKNFEQFMNDVNEASLKGNIGIPGEGNTQGPSWLDKTNREQQDKVRDLETEIKYLEEKLKILKKGKKPLYVLTLEFEEHKADPLDLDKIRFEFEIPVDEEYFKSSNIGDELGSGKRFMSLFHGG